MRVLTGTVAVLSLLAVASSLSAPLYTPQQGRTIGLQAGLHTGSDDVPITEAPWARTVTGTQPEQINVAYHSTSSVVVSWATGEAFFGDGVQGWNTSSAPSLVKYGTSADSLTLTTAGYSTFYQQNYFIPDVNFEVANYTSPLLHHVLLANLPESSTIYYQVGDGQTYSDMLSFKTLQPVGPKWTPYTWTVTADLGGTYNSTVTLEHLVQAEGDVSLLIGDFTYADNYLVDGTITPEDFEGPDTTYQPRWDGFFRFIQPLWSKTPFLASNGNHEYEESTDGQTYASYIARYEAPYKQSASPDPLYYSTDLPGVHLISLSAYRDYNETSDQYIWLEQDLQRFDRSVTPWLVVIFHPPWYNTFVSHYKEAECMRLAMEDLFYEHGVDLVLAGHVHAYERNNRVYNYTVDPCAPNYITIGDGGNIEEVLTKWSDQPGNCPNRTLGDSPGSKFKGNCLTFQEADVGGANDGYCSPSQPEWSAVRESSFGHGTLEVTNSTHLTWRWHRNQDAERVVADEFVIVREPAACANQNVAAPPTASVAASTASSTAGK